MYNSELFSFSGNESLTTVDAAAVRLYLNRFDSEVYSLGRGENSSCSGSFSPFNVNAAL